MERRSTIKSLSLFSLICILVLASGGSVLAEEVYPSTPPGLIVEEGSIVTRPEGSHNFLGLPNSRGSFIPPDIDPEVMAWALMVDEDFDGTFPYTGVELLNGNPGQDIFWGTDNYRSFSPDKGVHPGGLGVDAYEPRWLILSEQYEYLDGFWSTQPQLSFGWQDGIRRVVGYRADKR